MAELVIEGGRDVFFKSAFLFGNFLRCIFRIYPGKARKERFYRPGAGRLVRNPYIFKIRLHLRTAFICRFIHPRRDCSASVPAHAVRRDAACGRIVQTRLAIPCLYGRYQFVPLSCPALFFTRVSGYCPELNRDGFRVLPFCPGSY